MARLARVVIHSHPRHVTQRGNGRARTFFEDGDYALYRDLLAANCKGGDQFIARIERQTGRVLKPGKRGRKPSALEDN